MIPLTFLCDEYIDRPNLTEQKNPFEYIVPLPPPPQMGSEQLAKVTAFVTLMKIYKWKRLPKGLASYPETFEKVIDLSMLIFFYEFALVNLDITIFCRILKGHLNWLDLLHGRLNTLVKN